MATRFQITIDCRNPDALAAYWADALGYVVQPPPEGFADWPSFLATIGLSDRVGKNSAVVDVEGVGEFWTVMTDPEGNEFCLQ
jgi:hypothetical protein